MTPVRQLIRQPLRTVAALLILILASMFLSLSFGTWMSARQTAQEIQAGFVTIALPTNQMKALETDLGNGQIAYSYESVLTPEMQQWLETLPGTNAAVKGIYRQQFVSAYSPALTGQVSAQNSGCYQWILDVPYNDAAFVVQITEIQRAENILNDVDGGMVWANLTATVEETVLLHPGYTPRHILRLSCVFASQAELEALQEGSRYLVYGSNYVDQELELRESLAESCQCTSEEIDWGNISTDVQAEIADLKAHGEADADNIVAKYLREDGASLLTQEDLDCIDSASLNVQNAAMWCADSDVCFGPDGMQTTVSMAEATACPTIVPLTGSVEDFLASPEAYAWNAALEQAKIRQQCVPMLGTDLLESMFSFHQQETTIVDGRSFTQAEYEAGSRVCIISQTSALASGLQVGDSISLQPYWGAMPFLEHSANLTAQPYSHALGFAGEPERYEIVGLYRQSNQWSMDSGYSFTPNTVLVPNKALSCQTLTGQTGVLYGLVLENGGIEAVKAAVAAQGYPEDTLLYYDNSYDSFSETLDGFQKSAVQLLFEAGMAWFAILVLYLVLFVRSQRKNAGLMLSLGAGRRNTQRFIWTISLLPVVTASILGAITAGVLLKHITLAVFSNAREAMDLAFSAGSTVGQMELLSQKLTVLPWTVILPAVFQPLVYGLAVWIVAWCTARNTPSTLLCKKRSQSISCMV